MTKYLLKVNYTTQGLNGLLAEGGSARRQAAEATIRSAGGTLESMYFAFGDVDVFVIADFPDAKAAAAVAMKVSAGGGATVETVALLEVSEMDDAADRAGSAEYRPPGA